MYKRIFLIILMVSATFGCMFTEPPVLGGNVYKFVSDGFSLPVFDTHRFSGDQIALVGDIQMFPVEETYYCTIPLANPGRVNMTYTINTDDYALLEGLSNKTVASGIFDKVNYEIKFSFKPLIAADKKDIKFNLELKSNMRSYDTPDIPPIRINSRPSIVIPKKDSNGAEIENNTWIPIIENNVATIYWDYLPTVTDNDLVYLIIGYSINNIQNSEKIQFDSSNSKFGDNKFTLTGVPVDAKISFNFTVYDDEGLSSFPINSGDVTANRSPAPSIVRGDNDSLNEVTITSASGTQLYSKIDADDPAPVESPKKYNIITSHTIEAYTKKRGFLDSEVVSRSITAKYRVIYNGNGNTGGTVPIDDPYDYNTTAAISGNAGKLVKEGFVFLGWNTQPDGSGDDYIEGDTILIATEDITMYAQWISEDGLTIRFTTMPDYQSLVFNPSQVTVGKDQPVTLIPSNTDLATNGTNWQWFVDGIQSDNTTSNFVFSSSEIGDTIISCIVKYDNVLYSGSIKITVIMD